MKTSASARVSLLLALALASCGGSSTGSNGQPDPNTPGAAILDPDTGRYFLVDPNESGESQTPRILRAAWGRLVRVFGLGTGDPNGIRVEMQRNFLIAPSLVSGQGFLLERNAVTGEETLTILQDVNDPAGLEAFFLKLRSAEQNLAPIFDIGTGGSGLFTMVPRNAAIMVQFDDLMDTSTLDASTVKLQIGVPPLLPFESRLLMDPNHGDLADHDGGVGNEFYSTRVILDSTISQLEAFESDPPQPVNGIGLPPSLDVLTSNLEIRIPTLMVNGLQEMVLMNPSGHALTTASNGSIDFTSPTQDVVRAARSGGPSSETADPYNGFLPDQTPPQVTGSQLMTIDLPPVYLGAAEFTIPAITFESLFCSQTPVIGDIIAQTQIGVFAEVIRQPLPVAEGTVTNIDVRLLVWPSDWGIEPEEWSAAAIGSGQFLSAYNPGAGDPAACFVQVSPTPQGYPESPTLDIFSSSNFTIRFSEPMDPSSLSAFDALQILRTEVPEFSLDYISGTVQGTQDLQRVTYLPELPLAHAQGQSESYFLYLNDSTLGATDLAGNNLVQVFSEERGAETFDNVELTLLSTAAPQSNGSRVSRFTGPDEDPPIAEPGLEPLSEWGGQHTYDLSIQALRPRPVTRMQAIADRSNFMLAPMNANTVGIQSPISNFGSKTQTLWRFADVGLAAFDSVDYNMDVEGLSWAPFGGEVVVDNYSSFEIRLSHSFFGPDEPFAGSGLSSTFDNNLLNPTEDPQRIVHPRFLGYGIHPGDIFVVGQNIRMIPFPLNRTVPPSQFRYYTWRDTTLQSRAGPSSFGGPPSTYYGNMGLNVPITGDCMLMPTNNPFNAPGQVQSVFLPLLMEFRCFSDNSANGINRFDTSLAVSIPPANGGTPFFRAFSEGGVDTSQNQVLVDPDLEDSANGGYNPNSVPVPGAPTPGREDVVYLGAIDLVVRVSRSFSVWQQTVNPLGTPPVFLSPSYAPVIIEPRESDLPTGTSIEVALRGSTLVDPPEAEPLSDARELDAYGDHYTEAPSPCDMSITHNPDTLNLEISFLNNDMRWFDDISMIDGAQYYQVRVTFISNPESGESPELRALAVSWSE